MRIAAQKINDRGIAVSRLKTREVTEKYVKQLGQACEALYDLGYLPNPQYFDEDSFFECLFEDFPEIVPLCRNITTGSINLSAQQFHFVMKKLGDVHRSYEVLSAACKAMEAKQALHDIELFLENAHFKLKDDVLVCKVRLSVTNHVYCAGKLSLDSPYLRECFVVQPDKHIEEFDYSLEILRTVLKSIGVDESVDLYDSSVFLGDGFTVRDDCEFMNLLIRGDIEGSGKYASKLHESVEKYYSDYYRTRTTIAECIKYEEQMFLDAIPAAVASINAFRVAHPGYVEFFVDSKRVYWSVNGVAKKENPVERDIYIGEDIRSIGSTPVHLMNRLLSYSGEFLYRFDEAVAGYEVVGMPITLYSLNNGSKMPMEFYPASNLRKKVGEANMELTGDIHYSRDIIDVKDMLNDLEIDSLESLASEVADIVDVQYKVNPDSFKSLVGLLVQAVVCVMCDYTLDGRNSPNHIHLGSEYSWINDDIYADACAVAETFCIKLGF